MHKQEENTNEAESFAGLIKSKRKRDGLSQSQAASKWKISICNIQNWEQGRRTPKGYALSALEKFMRR